MGLGKNLIRAHPVDAKKIIKHEEKKKKKETDLHKVSLKIFRG